MTTTINASASSGLVQTADTSTILQLQTNGTAALTIDASQNVGIGTASPRDVAGYVSLGLNDTTGGLLDFYANGTRVGGIVGVSGNLQIGTATATPLIFNTDTNERMRIDSSGNVGIGTSSPGYPLDVVQKTSDDSYAFQLRGYTTGADGTRTVNMRTVSSNAGDWANFRMDATSFIWRHQGATERARIDSSGNLLVGKTAANDGSIVGVECAPNGQILATRNGSWGILVNRLTNDGDLVIFQQANTTEGSISGSGTTVSYNGGHLSRWAQTTTAKDESLVKGTVLSNLDEMNVYTDADGNPVDNEQLNKVKVSDVEGDANVAGVFVNWSHDEDHDVDEINMAMTGDMIIRIAQGTTVARGDLLMSAGDGTAKPQGDDIVRSKTVAKVTSTHVTCTHADGSYCVPCVLMAC